MIADGRVGTDAAGDGDRPEPTLRVVSQGVSWQLLSVLAGQGSWYVSLLVLAVLLPPGDFGVVAVGAVVSSVTLLFVESGAGGSLIIARELTAGSIRRSLLRTSLAGAVATVVLVALAQPLADAFSGGRDVWVLRAIVLTVGVSALAVVPNALLSKNLRFKANAQIAIVAAVGAAAAAIVAGALGAGVWALAVRLLVNAVLLSALSFAAARDLIPWRRSERGPVPRRAGGIAFLAIASATTLAWGCDNLVVGAFTSPTALGLYALAFSVAFAPLTQVSWSVGQVLLPAIAAARDPDAVRRQTVRAIRIMALLLLPLAPAAIALAPGVVPAVLGSRWAGMVVPLQLLVVVGVGQGVTNMLAEALAGSGAASAGMRARIDVVWAAATIAVLAGGVELDGIRGAALAHVVSFVALAAAYAWRADAAIGLSARALAAAAGPVLGCVVAQAAVTAAVTLVLDAAHTGALAAGVAGSAAGLLALAAALRFGAPQLLAEGGAVAAALRRRGRGGA